ncbi:MAG: NUDIX hydrolase [Candidatus Sumerlaeia bacterium]|nr:NUDIX hydrolase [Candidatus Sumerlaeia bacterium]
MSPDSRILKFRRDLETWAPEPGLQWDETRMLFRELCDQPSDPFDRMSLPGHFTASGFVIDESGRRILLVHHKKLGAWLQPGGHVESGDGSLFETSIREVLEETGVEALESLDRGIFDIDRHEIPAIGEMPAHWHYDVRHAFRALEERVIRQEDEVHHAGWFSLGDINAMKVDDSILRMLEIARKRGWLCQ